MDGSVHHESERTGGARGRGPPKALLRPALLYAEQFGERGKRPFEGLSALRRKTVQSAMEGFLPARS
ncbi:hypothetical protein [Streptomyces clavuligerus]|uniref:hypothetical protein n=1 Tax=Streptomyces clavuligerus TaxID=1901 RepID=UPI00020D90FD|nr:hypothetical protein [Streptomyces clavuligerus]WDN57652.1 hypothetical protein LL058_38000 [Streptomyces clavuligerus]